MSFYVIKNEVRRNAFYEFDLVNTKTKKRRTIRVSQNTSEAEVTRLLDTITAEMEKDTADIVDLVNANVKRLNEIEDAKAKSDLLA